MKRGCKADRRRADCDRAMGIAALAGAVLVLLKGRRCCTCEATTTVTETPPTPAPPERTGLEKVTHCLTEPVRKKDRDKQRLEENPPKAPEPPKSTCRKPSVCCLTHTCGEAAAPAAGDTEAPEKKEDPNSLMGIVLKALGAVATGIGIVGAVTVVGAAVFWVRFDAIGLPATQAVSVIPKAELLVQGAQEMVIFIGIGLLAVLLIALSDPKGLVTWGTFIVLCLFVSAAFAYAGIKGLEFELVLAMGAVALILALLCVAIAFNTGQRLLPLLVSIFVASLIFSSSCALLIVHDQKYAQAIAIRFGAENKVGKGITGIYVTATSDTIYYARTGADLNPKLNGIDTTGVYEVHRTDATTFAIGPLGPTHSPGGIDRVEKQGKNLLERLNLDGENFVPPEATATTDGAAKEAAQ